MKEFDQELVWERGGKKCALADTKEIGESLVISSSLISEVIFCSLLFTFLASRYVKWKPERSPGQIRPKTFESGCDLHPLLSTMKPYRYFFQSLP